MNLTPEQIVDLVKTTLRKLDRNKVVFLASDLTDYPAARRLFPKNKISQSSGTALQFNIMLKDSGAASFVGMYATIKTDVTDVMEKASVDWKFSNTHFVIEDHEITMNATPAQIVDLIKVRKADAMFSEIKLWEREFWLGLPGVGDTLRPNFLRYYVVRNTSEPAGFTGKNPSGHSNVAGLDTTLEKYKNYRNWAGQYTQVTKTDLVRKIREACTKTSFINPVVVPGGTVSDQRGYYANYRVISKLEELLENQNDNLKNDIASKDGSVLFRGRPVEYVPQLEEDPDDPFIGLNWAWFKPVFLTGWYQRASGTLRDPNQHLVTKSHFDTTMNVECKNRREQFILSTGEVNK